MILTSGFSRFAFDTPQWAIDIDRGLFGLSSCASLWLSASTKIVDKEVGSMSGLIAALTIIGAILLIMCVVYKRVTGGHLLKDLFCDIFLKG